MTRVDLPGVKKDDVKATFANGVFEVKVPLPFAPESKARKVQIEDVKGEHETGSWVPGKS